MCAGAAQLLFVLEDHNALWATTIDFVIANNETLQRTSLLFSPLPFNSIVLADAP
jgi:hypothetical protein